ncbi:hypothetical protein B0H19DRAFT_1078150 [Mycena capillaripes]|nr:hypothetical protein B0H19DRAFT_1078150 [Mycena capillaripes]
MQDSPSDVGMWVGAGEYQRRRTMSDARRIVVVWKREGCGAKSHSRHMDIRQSEVVTSFTRQSRCRHKSHTAASLSAEPAHALDHNNGGQDTVNGYSVYLRKRRRTAELVDCGPATVV